MTFFAPETIKIVPVLQGFTAQVCSEPVEGHLDVCSLRGGALSMNRSIWVEMLGTYGPQPGKPLGLR